jgi:hypothetical protein
MWRLATAPARTLIIFELWDYYHAFRHAEPICLFAVYSASALHGLHSVLHSGLIKFRPRAHCSLLLTDPPLGRVIPTPKLCLAFAQLLELRGLSTLTLLAGRSSESN